MGVTGFIACAERGMIRAANEERRLTAYLLVAAVTVGCLWIPPLQSSLWLDEAATFWTVKEGLWEAADRSLRYQGQSPAYYVILWLALWVGGTSEIVLRLPSLIAAVVATLLLYRLGTRLLDPEGGLLTATAFVCLAGAAGVPANARPYAIALMLAVGSTLALVRWLERPGTVAAGSYVVTAALTVYVHYLFGIMLVVHILYAVARGRADGIPTVARMAAAVAAVGVLLLPTGSQVISITRRAESLSFADDPSLAGLLGVLAGPLSLIGALAWRGPKGRGPLLDRASFLLVVAWSILPPLVVALASWLTAGQVFFPRYYLAWIPGLSLLLGAVVRTMGGVRARSSFAIGLVILSVAVFGPVLRSRQDWRSATQAVRELTVSADADTPVLVSAGLIESAQIDWLSHPERSSYLLSPFAFYRVPGRLVALPYALSDEGRAYLETLISDLRATERRFILVWNDDRLDGRPVVFQEWFKNRLGADFGSRRVGPFGSISVVVFERKRCQ